MLCMVIFALLLLVSGVPAPAESFVETLPAWFVPLREAIYEQKLAADEIAPLYRDVSNTAVKTLSGAAQCLMLSRCEYMMGRAYHLEDRKNEASAHYEKGMEWAEKSLEVRASAEAWRMLAENISQNCVVRSTSYAMANGLKVEKYAKNALAIDSRNAAAQYLIAARWVYAPAPFNNYNKGIEMMNAIPNESNMEKDDVFNVYSSLGYVYIQQKKYAQARSWLLKSLEIYPTNKYAQSLLAKL